MCDFHLRGQCFHPEKARKGLVSVDCTFHDCSQCTNKQWQQSKIHENFTYYESIVKLANISQEQLEGQESQPFLTRIFSSKPKSDAPQ